ncbi:hypothetical protein [Streptomyces sp. NPDC004685]
MVRAECAQEAPDVERLADRDHARHRPVTSEQAREGLDDERRRDGLYVTASRHRAARLVIAGHVGLHEEGLRGTALGVGGYGLGVPSTRMSRSGARFITARTSGGASGGVRGPGRDGDPAAQRVFVQDGSAAPLAVEPVADDAGDARVGAGSNVTAVERP